MKKILLLLGVVFSAGIFAQATFPLQCKKTNLSFTENNLSLMSKKIMPRAYAITNVGKNPIWLNQVAKNQGAGMGAGFASQLYPQHWSVLLVNKPSFVLSCQAQDAKGRMLTVSCQKILRVCQFENGHTVAQGNYWLVENVMQSQLMSRIHSRGL